MWSMPMTSVTARLGWSLLQFKTLFAPACDAAEHFLYRAAQFRQPQRGFCRSIAMRSGTINYEQSVGRKWSHLVGGDCRVRDVHRAGNVSAAIQVRGADIEQDKSWLRRPHGI